MSPESVRLSRIDLRGQHPPASELRGLLPRARLDVGAALELVRPVCEDVRWRGAQAVLEATARFDGVRLERLRVPADRLAQALAEVDPRLRTALAESAGRARTVHRAQLRDDVHIQVTDGGTVTERWVPVRRAGLYVPGGLVPYPSSVVMNVIPAQVAGPTEIGVLADDSADAAHVAADLISQAEHDVLASCLPITDSEQLLDKVQAELDSQVAAVLVSDIDAAVRVADAWAAEHLEVITRDADTVAARVRNAGAVFVGPWSPVTLGDYLAGSNHVLPTGGTARFTGGLAVQAFQKMVHVVRYDHGALARAAGPIDVLGAAEDLPGHVAAVRARIPR